MFIHILLIDQRRPLSRLSVLGFYQNKGTVSVIWIWSLKQRWLCPSYKRCPWNLSIMSKILSFFFSVEKCYKFYMFFCSRNAQGSFVENPQNYKNEFILDLAKLLKVHLSESDIAIFAWRVTWNYAYSPFKWDTPYRKWTGMLNRLFNRHCMTCNVCLCRAGVYLHFDGDVGGGALGSG